MRLLSLACLALALPLHAQIDAELLAGMKARSIGPASMSGRVAAIDAVESDPEIVYVGAATGGVWKSTDGALSFRPIFDDQPVAAIGAVAIFQPSPDIVWVGTGEGNPRNSMSVGNGIYKSIDAGATWKHLGLDKSERIHRIITHPSNPDVVWVAAMGQAWGENAERGIFKTTDGGRSWTKVLYVNERTGAADLLIDPSNPNKLFAAMWEYRRWPWFFNSGGPGSGLFVTYDGGTTWKRSTEEDGMPKGNLGRIGVAISRSHLNIVYALVEAEESALLRSDDGGKKWATVNKDPSIASRPFYYADIRVDPADPNRVYNVWSLVSLSTDGGKSFKVILPFAKIHPDYHAFWIDPNDPTHIYAGNDGGVAESEDRGASWRFVSTLPLAQYYHIAVDDETPYNVYGGMQDNGSWRGPNTTWETAGIRNWDWQEVGFGDGFGTLPVPNDPTAGYAMSQEGYLIRWDLATGARRDIRPAPPTGGNLRFNWNAAIATDPFAPDALYFGSQYVHRSTDRGNTWKTISPDLTTNRADWQHQDKSGGLTPDVTAAENFTTIITIAPSPRDRNVVWVGTDDGRVHVTRDGGASWTSLEGNIKGVPANTWVPEITASKHDAATAFIVFDDHRRSNWTPYVYRTSDYGRTWTSLATKEIQGYALSIEQDPVDPDLLFLGTEFGLWVSVDAGKSWMKWKHGFPTVSVMGLAIQPREHDLVIGTHGRSAYVLDDIRPLRTISRETLARPLHFFEVPDAQAFTTRQKEGSRFVGDGEFRGENQPYGALLTFSLNFKDLPHPTEEKERLRKEQEREAARKPGIPATGVPIIEDIPKEPEASAMRQQEKTPGTPAVPPPATTPSTAGASPSTPSAAAPGSEKTAGMKDEKAEAKATDVDVEVSDASGGVIRRFKVPAKLGVNRTAWDLTRDAFKRPVAPGAPEEMFPQGGVEVLPGVYTIALKFRGQEAKQTVRVLADPREQIPPAAMQAKYEALLRAGKMQEQIAEAVKRIQQTRADIDTVTARVKKDEPGVKAEPHPLAKSGAELKKKLDTMERRLWVPPTTKGYIAEKDAMAKIGYPFYAMSSSWDAPTEAHLTYLQRGEEFLREVLADFNKLYAEDVAKYRTEVLAEKVTLFPEDPPLQ